MDDVVAVIWTNRSRALIQISRAAGFTPNESGKLAAVQFSFVSFVCECVQIVTQNVLT